MGFLERACNQCFIGGGGAEVGDGGVAVGVGGGSHRGRVMKMLQINSKIPNGFIDLESCS